MIKSLRGAVLLFCSLLGCVTTPPAVGEPAPALKDAELERSYRELVARYSAHGEIYTGFDTRLFVATTFESVPFREARVRRMGLFKVLPDQVVDAQLVEERAQAAKENQFFFGIHVNDPSFDDFGRPKSIWRLALVTPSGEYLPVLVKRMGRSTLDIRSRYPYLADFWIGYMLTFPLKSSDGTLVIPDGTQEVTLRVASSLGKFDLRVNAL